MPKPKKAQSRPTMVPYCPGWEQFIRRLEGPEGCNFKDNPDVTKITWTCNHTHEKAEAILIKMGYDVKSSVDFLKGCGGGCDCEILLNLDAAQK